MIRGTVGVAAITLVVCSGARGQPGRWIGAEGCRPCHETQYKRQSADAHARSLFRAVDHPLAARFATAEPLERPPGFHLDLGRGTTGLRLHADDGRYVTEVPAEWAFGAGKHAVTFLGRVSAEYYLEISLSYFAGEGVVDLTPRHDALPSRTLNESMGQVIRTRTAGVTCFGCHSTGPVTVSPGGEIGVTERGVRCEVCHGEGGLHREAAAAGRLEEARKRIGKPPRDGVGLNEFCGKCHRVLGNLRAVDWNSPWSVRHQPPYLSRSACFRASGGKLSCFSCHDAHGGPERKDAGFYRGRCMSCHGSGGHPPKGVCGPDCAGCHMPAVEAGPHLRFVNHWIGVYGEDKLRPRDRR